MRRIFLASFVCIAFNIFMVSAAFAQNITTEGAEAVKEKINTWLDTQIKLMALSDEQSEDPIAPITLDGETTVTAEDGYYAAKLPFMVFSMDEDRRLEVGQIAMNIVPDVDTPEIWGMTMAMPKTMPVVNSVGDNVGQLEIGGQRFKGRLDTQRDIFLQYEMAYENIVGREKNGDVTSLLKIGQMTAEQNLQPLPDNPDLYSGPLNFSARNIEAGQDGPNGMTFKAASMQGATVYAQIPLFDAKGFQEDMLKYTEDSAAPNADHDVLKTVFETFNYLPANVTSEFQIQDVQVISDDEDGRSAVNAETIDFKSTGSDLKSDSARMNAGYIINGMSFEGMPENYTPYLPYLSQMNIEVSQFPVKSILELVSSGTTTALNQNAEMSDEQRGQMLDATFKMIGPLLAKHGATLTISDTQTLAKDFGLVIGGNVIASAASPRGYIGDILIEINGMDDAVNALRETMSKNEESRMFLQQVILGLGMAQSVGQLDETGKNRRYKFEFKENGDIFVNGINFGAFMGSMAH